jgi:hypothetical protein
LRCRVACCRRGFVRAAMLPALCSTRAFDVKLQAAAPSESSGLRACSQWRGAPSESTRAKRARTGGVFATRWGEGAGLAFCPKQGFAQRKQSSAQRRRLFPGERFRPASIVGAFCPSQQFRPAPGPSHHPRLLDRRLCRPRGPPPPGSPRTWPPSSSRPLPRRPRSPRRSCPRWPSQKPPPGPGSLRSRPDRPSPKPWAWPSPPFPDPPPLSPLTPGAPPCGPAAGSTKRRSRGPPTRVGATMWPHRRANEAPLTAAKTRGRHHVAPPPGRRSAAPEGHRGPPGAWGPPSGRRRGADVQRRRLLLDAERAAGGGSKFLNRFLFIFCRASPCRRQDFPLLASHPASE